MSANIHELSPAVKHVIRLSPKMLADDLPFYDGKYGRIILAEALQHMDGRAATLVRARIAAIDQEEAEISNLANH